MFSADAALAGAYDYRLVLLSVAIAICASYTALDLAGRVMATSGQSRRAWLAGGATVMGLGIWSMHYIGMLAFSLPVPVQYDWPTVLASLLAAVLASGVALYVVSRPRMGWMNAAVGSLFMGAGIATMHYVGMAAMRLAGMCHYSAPIVALSVVLAIVISFVGIWLLFLVREENKASILRKLLNAAVMGAAIPVMHYTGMAASTFAPSATIPDLSNAVSVDMLGIAGIAIVTFMVLGLTLLTTVFDRKYSARTQELEAVLDWMMPLLDGVDVCRAVRHSAREPYLYIILLTAKGHQTEIIEGLEAGADDYIVKPYDLQELKARIRTGKRILELQEQLVNAREQLRIQATHDSLTGLFNRRAILEALERETTRSYREKHSMAVIMADLDHFKEINDTYGHQAGDAVLQETARRMLSSVRTYDFVGRYGGEEFLVVVPGSELGSAAELAERLRQAVSAQPVTFADVLIPVTLSLGVVASAAELGQPGQLLRQADEALYVAKKTGRNKVESALTVQPTAPHAG